MSEFVTSLQTHLAPTITSLAEQSAQEFLGGLASILDGADENARAKVLAIVNKGFEFKEKALTASNLDEARLYAGEVETSARRVKTILLAERLVAEESFATVISNLFWSALETFGKLLGGLIEKVVAGLASGAVSGLIAGDGGAALGASDIFPGLG